jgi:C-3',4' desaturase CrtD
MLTQRKKQVENPRIIVIGAGIGGLVSAAALARAGLQVTVLEAHVYPGGCAGTFYHQGYRFDAGATLAGGFYPGGPMDLAAKSAGIEQWKARPAPEAMQVHLPDGTVVRLTGEAWRWRERLEAFGPAAIPFWQWQERTADALWDLALRRPPWPPQSLAESLELLQKGFNWLKDSPHAQQNLVGLARDAFRPLGARLPADNPGLRLLADGQLLISAQATSSSANALFGAAAMDLPRKGVVHLEGGIGTIAQQLVQAIQANGGKVLMKQEAIRIVLEDGQPQVVETRQGDSLTADLVIANLTPWNLARLLGEAAPTRLRRITTKPPAGWGAFVVYLGVESTVIPANLPLHHQVIARRPLGEGNSIFLSISPAWDASRAPQKRRAITISTHTGYSDWWRLYESDPEAYARHKQAVSWRLIQAAESVLPGLRQAAELVLPGTPLAFQRFTRRTYGWVGGYPQTSLLRSQGPHISPGIWMTGDSIFPGQSIAATALGGLRVAHTIIASHRPEAIPELESLFAPAYT